MGGALKLKSKIPYMQRVAKHCTNEPAICQSATKTPCQPVNEGGATSALLHELNPEILMVFRDFSLVYP